MKRHLFFSVLIVLLLAAGTAQAAPDDAPATPEKQQVSQSAPGRDSSSIPEAVPAQAADVKKKTDAFNEDYTDEEDHSVDVKAREERVAIADPIQPFNRAMGIFNDRMYFWVLKPVTLGYKAVVPEPARISVKNFFTNLRYPSRFVSCLLQTDFEGAATETGRFLINTIWGLGGLMDPAAGGELNLKMQDTDLGQTLGVYGVGHGLYIVWPVMGPSSLRDSVDIAGDQVLYPLSYANIWYASIGTWTLEKVNKTSFHIGDYESILGAAIDPYIAVRDGYAQYRAKAIKARKVRSLLFKERIDEAAPTSKTKKE